MDKLNLNGAKKALVIVAHPDDETIWMGGTILQFKQIDWTIVSLCRASDLDRAPKYDRVCKYYGAKGIITDLDDEDKLSLEESLPAISTILSKNLKGAGFDLVFTHGLNGEYGHPRHIGSHLATLDSIRKGVFTTNRLACFNYKKVSRQEFSPLTGKKDSDFYLNLSKKAYAEKKSIMTRIYGFDPNGIDANYCTNPEAFKSIKI